MVRERDRRSAILVLAIGLITSSSSGLTGGSVKSGTTLDGHTFSDRCAAADPPVDPPIRPGEEDDAKCERFRQNENCRPEIPRKAADIGQRDISRLL
jgi:hypothetical protein